MDNRTKFKVSNGLLSALLVAPVVATASTALAEESNETPAEQSESVVYHNDFESPDNLNHPVQDAGSTLTHTDNLLFDENENNSGVWVTDRSADWSGIDVRFDGLDLEAGVDYTLTILGYIDAEEDIPSGAQLTLQYPDTYGWVDGTEDLVPGESFVLEGDYTHTENPDNVAFRVQSNAEAAEVDFAIADILITTESIDEPDEDNDEDNDEEADPEEPSEGEVIYHDTFIDGLGLAAQAGNATLNHLPDFTVGDKTGAIQVTDRTENHDGIDLTFDSLGMELGNRYDITVHGYVDNEATPGTGDQAVIQLPSGDYPVVGGADFVPGEEFVITGTREWTDEEYTAFRIQSSWIEGGRAEEIDFYVTEITVRHTGEVDFPDQPDPDAPDAEVFTLIDFEDGESAGFEGRNGTEELVVTDEENRTPGGQYSLHVSNRQDNWHGPELEVTPYISPGETYEVSVWVKVDEASSQTITLSTQIGDASPTYGNIASATLNADDGWVEIRGERRYTSVADGFVSIYVESSNTNLDFYVDDVNFELVESDPIDVQLDLAPLKDVYADHFTIGNIVSSPDVESPRVDLLRHHHDLVTAENAMKPEGVYDGREFDFTGVNSLIERVNEENLDLHGHVLVWHSQSPDWHHTENGQSLSREEALENMRTHIRTVMENFGEIRSWDVVNEALAGGWENPEEWRHNLRNTGWLRAIGEDYIYEAFSYARQVADENGWHDMVLYYNDYNDHVQGKARTMYYMVKEINEQYAAENPDDDRKLISGLGMQGHYNININPENVKQSIERFEQLGIEIGITELDVTLNEGVTVDNLEAEMLTQAQIYARLFQIFREHSDSIDRVTFWGLDDASSWRSERYPLIFDGSLRAKPAYYAVIDPDGFLEENPLRDAAANQGYAVYGTPEINAEIDSVWEQAPVLNMNRMQQAHEIAASGFGRVLWDENNLYILFEVTDGNLDASASEAHEQDSVEAFVNETNETTTSYIDGVGQYRVNYENEASFNPGRYSEGFESATRLTGSGYVVEMAIPWKGMTPEAWDTIGFDIQINDARDGARHGVAAWNDYTGTGWQDPSVFGELTLIRSVEDMIAILEERITELEESVAEHQENFEELVAELTELQNLLDALKEEADEANEAIAELEDRVRELEERLAELEGLEPVDPEEPVQPEEPEDEEDEDEDSDETEETDADNGKKNGIAHPGDDDSDTEEDDAEAGEPSEDEISEDYESGERLPETATATWTVGVIGLIGALSGAGLHFLQKKK